MVEAADGNANKASCESGITVSNLVRSAVVIRAWKAVQLRGKF
jgi:hypothetical protein